MCIHNRRDTRIGIERKYFGISRYGISYLYNVQVETYTRSQQAKQVCVYVRAYSESGVKGKFAKHACANDFFSVNPS